MRVDFEEFFRLRLLDHSALQENIDERFGGAVIYRGFDVVEFDNEIVYLQTSDGGQHVLDGIYLRLAFLDGRTAIQSDDVIDIGRYFGRAGKVGAYKADAGTGLQRA